MKRFITIIAILLLCRMASAQNPRASYIKRTQTISRDAHFAIGQLSLAWETMDATDGTPRRRESEEETAQRASRRDAARAAILKVLPSVRANAKRLRSVSPVPRLFKKADDRFIDAGYALEASMASLEMWLLQPSDLWKSQTEKHLRKALTDIEAAARTLAERSENGVANKTYID